MHILKALLHKRSRSHNFVPFQPDTHEESKKFTSSGESISAILCRPARRFWPGGARARPQGGKRRRAQDWQEQEACAGTGAREERRALSHEQLRMPGNRKK
eukprot:6177911-Pleurochrysis_carterae.AAC.2